MARLRLILVVIYVSFLIIAASADPQGGKGGGGGDKRKKGQHQQQQNVFINNKQKHRPSQTGKPSRATKAPVIKDEPNNIDSSKTRVIIKMISGLGRIRGRIIKSEWSGKDILHFYDIPYGKSPTGVMRFKLPEPADPWQGTFNAFKPHIGCPSLKNFEKFEALEEIEIDIEDCLRLSVSTKSIADNKAPVMVYIHGDFLYDGNSLEAAPGYLLEENIVLVSVRYRLGPFGFLSTMTEDIPGNAAVHDVILALQWIQDHIESFGGDPKRVTLFGQVGGAALINVLTLSPAVPDDLFHRVIYQSASALSPTFITDNPIAASREIARFAGCKNVNKIKAINKCMRQLNTTALLAAFNAHGDAKAELGIGSYGGAQIVIGGPSGILPEHPGKLIAADKFRAYPTIGGAVKNGGTLILKDIYIDNFNETIIDDKLDGLGYIERIITQTNGADPTGAWKMYAQEEIFSASDIKNGSFYRMIPGLIDMCSVIPFKNPILLSMQANAKRMPKNTFLYSFEYEGEMNRYITSEDNEGSMPFELGVSLTDDNLYLFPWPYYRVLNSLRDIKMAKRMVAYWTSFAANGVPMAKNGPAWPAMTDDTGPYIKINRLTTIADNYLDEYTSAVKEARLGYNLVNEVFFESLVEIKNSIKNGGNDERDDDDTNQGRGTNIVIIAKKTKL